MKILKYILASISVVLLTTGCFDDPGTDILFSGSFVELDAAGTPAGSRTYTYLRENIGATPDAGFTVLLASGTSTGTTVNFEIDATSTAVDGLHYNVTGSSVTIPAGEFSAELPITINVDNIEAGEQWTIIVNLTGGDVAVSDAYGSGTHIVQISCESDIGGTYDAVSSGNIGVGGGAVGGTYSGVAATIVVTDDGGGHYSVTDLTFGMYAAVYGNSNPQPGGWTDVCDVMTGDATNADQYADPITLTGTRDSGTGVITMTWSNTWGDSGNVTLTPQ